MKFAIVFAALAVVALAAPLESNPDLETRVVKYENERSDSGEYSYTVELSDGTIRHEEGRLVDIGSETEHMVVKGYFIYKGPDAQLYKTEYSADEEGYQAVGEHLPKNE